MDFSTELQEVRDGLCRHAAALRATEQLFDQGAALAGIQGVRDARGLATELAERLIRLIDGQGDHAVQRPRDRRKLA